MVRSGRSGSLGLIVNLCGVLYCEERDVYVVGDNPRVHCLWYIDAGSGAVVRQVGSEGMWGGTL